MPGEIVLEITASNLFLPGTASVFFDTCQVAGLSSANNCTWSRGFGWLGGGETDWMTGSSWSECLMFTFINH